MAYEIECEECDGTGNDPGGLNAREKTDCPACSGYGKILVIEDEDEVIDGGERDAIAEIGGIGMAHEEAEKGQAVAFAELSLEEQLIASIAIANYRKENVA